MKRFGLGWEAFKVSAFLTFVNWNLPPVFQVRQFSKVTSYQYFDNFSPF